ncbi:efflux RND transporter permease subunit, partial [Aquitalea sp. S1-19]|nr:efflux RND transporter permease subunit [Aquitalea sp. S1-19]
MGELTAIPGIGRPDVGSESQLPMLAVQVKREAAARAGLSTQQVLAAVNLLTAGSNAAQFSDGDGERYDIRVKAATGSLNRAADL